MFLRYVQSQPRAGDIEFVVDSAGTGSWHVGQSVDPRSAAEGRRRGLKMEMRARQVCSQDFDNFDLLVAMDQSIAQDLREWPGSVSSKIVLMRQFDENARSLDVEDPYYGGQQGFIDMGNCIEAALPGLYKRLINQP